MSLILAFVLACTGKDDSPGVSFPDDTDVTDDTGEIDPDAAVRAIDPSTLPAGANPCDTPRLVRVTWVVDGDTADVVPDGGGPEERLRFIGLNAPELAYGGNEGDCYGEEASLFVRELIKDRLIWLTFDGNCTDRYDRTLAYLHLDAREEGFVNRYIVRSGYAFAYPFDETDTFEAEFDADETFAREAGLAMWGACDL
ncbi:MAG: thermonuclease family protein [Alphaproteobacteria bacterium]|nr:thermonuclease family protein [Alphaproteobacteria bacterium]